MNQAAPTPEVSFSFGALSTFFRLSRASVDDSITQNLDSLDPYSARANRPTALSRTQHRAALVRENDIWIRSDSSSSPPMKIFSVKDSAPVGAQRHVRFDDVPSSDSDSTEFDEGLYELFPDIFIDKRSLDPTFRRKIDHETDNPYGESFWDCLDHPTASESDNDRANLSLAASTSASTPASTPVECQTPVLISDQLPSQNCVGLEDYGSDGNTTDEETPEPSMRSNARWASSEAESSDSDFLANLTSPKSPRAKSTRGTPRLGSFNLDRSDQKPIAVVNPTLRKMIIFTPQHHHFGLSPEQFDLSCFGSLSEISSPIMSSSADLMLSALYSPDAFGGYLGYQALNPTDNYPGDYEFCDID